MALQKISSIVCLGELDGVGEYFFKFSVIEQGKDGMWMKILAFMRGGRVWAVRFNVRIPRLRCRKVQIDIPELVKGIGY